MIAPFLKVVVDGREEGRFRRRALRYAPKETISALWGYVRGDTVYICAFIKCDINKKETNTRKVVCIDEDLELDRHEDDAKDTEIYDSVSGRRIKLEFLGTIHTHPDCDDAVLSEHDIRDSLNTQESILAVCAIQIPKDGSRRKTVVSYWPCLRPLAVERKKNYESFVAKAGAKCRAKRRRR
jgi:proteasome lid subunit RPN8/RPN11